MIYKKKFKGEVIQLSFQIKDKKDNFWEKYYEGKVEIEATHEFTYECCNFTSW